jgi:proline racemase
MARPEVSGSAYITGEHTFYLDPADPTRGFSLTGGDD